MKKYLYIVRLGSFFTEISGDVIGKGEFSITVSNEGEEHQYPSEGFIRLGKNETFAPRPYPTICTGTIESEQKVTLHVKVTEHDLQEDDIFIDSEFSIHTEFFEQNVDIVGTDHPCKLSLNILIEHIEIAM
jgi:hypothetical protein